MNVATERHPSERKTKVRRDHSSKVFRWRMRAVWGNRRRGAGFFACLIAVASLDTLRADFSYQETTQILGGPVQKPVTYLLKGNRIAAVSKDHIRVIDVDREIVTEMDLVKKTYAATTFAQIKQGKDAEAKL